MACINFLGAVLIKKLPCTFQREIEVTLSSVKTQSALVYLDDIVSFSKTIHDHLTSLRRVLTLLRNFGLALKLKQASLQRR